MVEQGCGWGSDSEGEGQENERTTHGDSEGKQ
jgi:hypothetical protein